MRTFQADAAIGEFGLRFSTPRRMESFGEQNLGMYEIFVALGTVEHPGGHLCFAANWDAGGGLKVTEV
jgi:hypothetical protein